MRRPRVSTGLLALLTALLAASLTGPPGQAAAPAGRTVAPTVVPTTEEPGSIVSYGFDPFTHNQPPAEVAQTPLTAVSAAFGYSLALTTDGRILFWGLPRGGTAHPPVRDDIAAVDASTQHALALTRAGEVLSWGGGKFQPPKSVRRHRYVAIAAGLPDLAVTTTGRVVAWNTLGRRQTGPLPAALDGQVVTDVAAGGAFSLALTAQGKVVAWGDDSVGQTEVPAALDDRVVTAISAGSNFAAALLDDGTVVAWGEDSGGQTDVPPGLTGVTAISAGDFFTAALTSDGHVVTWGQGAPEEPAYLRDTRVTAVSAAFQRVVALAVPLGDHVPPVITGPGFIALRSSSRAGQVVDYPVPGAVDSIDGPVAVTCDPPPGSFFPVGVTPLTCTATDSSGNVGTRTVNLRLHKP